jgi:uncharacterized protein (DUF1697 family)
VARYAALLRGINVGGKNLVRMDALVACFEAQGLRDVRTYIQSGNVLFASGERAPALVTRLEAALSAVLGRPATVVVRSLPGLRAIVRGAPEGFGAAPARYRYDVLFLKEPLTAAAALAVAPAKPGVDQVSAGRGVLYYSRLARKASQSRMSRIVALPVYQQMTIRSWTTTVRLLELLEQAGDEG